MTPISPIDQAVQFHLAGNLQEAERCYRQILQTNPQHFDALHLLGVLCNHVGRGDLAIGYIGEALRIMPSSADAHSNLGMALQGEGRIDEAIASYRQALRLNPDFVEAYNNLGNALHAQGKFDEAVVCCRQAVRLRPDFAGAHNNLGNALQGQGKLEEAIACYRQALRLVPDDAQAHNNLGAALNSQGKFDESVASCQQALRLAPDFVQAHINLGNALQSQGKLDEAVACYRQALQLNADCAEAHCNLGVALQAQGKEAEATACYREALRLKPEYPEARNNLAVVGDEQGKFDEAEAQNNRGAALGEQGRLDEAVACFQQALRLAPDFAQAHNNLGFALQLQGKFEAAIVCFEQAVRLKPDYAGAYINLGAILHDQGRDDEAEACFRNAVRFKPDSADAHQNLGMWLLLHGDFEQGWPEYEWRWQPQKFCPNPRQFAEPRWDGSDLTGKTILMHAEQGIGDIVQFLRYASLVQKRGGAVVFECPDHLMRLLGRLPGVDRLVKSGSPLPAFDAHLPLLSAPGIFGTTLATIPADVPYLAVEPDLVQRWADELEPSAKLFRVGISWQGNPKHNRDRNRSFPLASFEPLAGIDGVQLFSLQKGPGSEQLAQVEGRFSVIDLGPRLDLAGAFVDTAAVMKNLDLVISADTATAHVAGALGVPVWIALALVPDWRWLLGREDSPWYPTMRLFRQTAVGDWHDVFARMALALARLVAEARPARERPPSSR